MFVEPAGHREAYQCPDGERGRAASFLDLHPSSAAGNGATSSLSRQRKTRSPFWPFHRRLEALINEERNSPDRQSRPESARHARSKRQVRGGSASASGQ